MSSTQQAPGLRSLFVLAWPVVLARSSQSVIGFCDALMIAPLGDDALAATTTGAINAFSLAILPMGIVFIVQSFSAQLKGKGDLLGARRYAWYGLGLAAAVMVLAALATPLVGPVLGVLDYQPAVHRQMTDYLVIRLLAMGAVVGTEALGNWYGGLGNTRLQMIAGVLAMVVNVALNWVLIGGNLGAPALGVTGAAIASVIASWAGLGLLALAFGRGWGTERARGPLGLSMVELWRMLRFGIPNGINWFFEFAALTLFINVVVAGLGTAVHAAMMVVIQINSVSFMPAFGLTSAGAILVGQAIGAGRHDDVPRIVRRTGLVTAGWQCGVGMLYLLIPGVLMGWFAASGAPSLTFLEVGTTLLAISAAWQLFDAIAMTMGEALRAAGDTAWSMWARIALAWLVFTPGSILAVSVLGGGPIAAILCMVVYMATLALAMSWRFYSGAWRNIDLTGSPAPVSH